MPVLTFLRKPRMLSPSTSYPYGRPRIAASKLLFTMMWSSHVTATFFKFMSSVFSYSLSLTFSFSVDITASNTSGASLRMAFDAVLWPPKKSLTNPPSRTYSLMNSQKSSSLPSQDSSFPTERPSSPNSGAASTRPNRPVTSPTLILSLAPWLFP